jgi:predicted flap endonuclease-1-like 5' DNA nuclease
LQLTDDQRYATLQGKAIWILGFFSFLSGLFAIHAIILAVNLGFEGLYQPWLIGSLTGDIPVYVYLLATVIATLIFLGATSSKVVSDLSNKSLLNEINAKAKNLENGQQVQQSLLDSLKARVFLVDESLNAARKEISEKFSDQDKEIKQVYTNLANRFDTKLADVKNVLGKQVGDGLSEQTEMLKEFHASLVDRFDTKLGEVKDGVTRRLVDIESTMKKHERRNRNSAAAIVKQSGEIASIKLKIERLEDALTTPKPQLTSKSDTEEVRGIGPNTKDELKEMGITNVEQLILTDPKVIAEKTTISEKTAEKLQGAAQLSMVPGVREKDLVLLEEVGILNRKELANQDPLELGRKINAIFPVCVEKGKISEIGKPTIEEVYSWVKSAKT